MCAAFNTPPVANPGQPSARPPDEVRGTLERITFHNEDNGYTVARLLPEGARDVVTITGNFTSPVVGESLVCYGVWTRHAQWGRQMQVQRYETVRPATAHAIEKYLGSGMVKGVGPVTAKRIVAKFGEEALDIIEKTPRKLLQVQGIGEKTLKTIKDAWKEQSEIRNIMLFLQGHGISPAYAIKIYKTYQERSIAIVEKNPYQLATDIWGIGFKSADKIARNLGFAEDDPRRLEAGVVYVLNESVDTGGNAFLTREELVKASGEILGPFDIADSLETLTDAGKLVLEESSLLGTTETAIYTPSLYNTERSLAQRLKDFVSRPVKVSLDTPKAQEWLAQVLAKNDFTLTDEQQAAVRMTLQARVSVITGGPGVGKTMSTRAVVAAFKGRQKRVLLASPTGRAAKRLSEMTGAEASTIHRMLSFDPAKRQFVYNADNPLECDVLLVDEASMLDMVLAYSLLKAVPDTAQVIFVGDVDQLPSVGPGNVLRDMIDSGIVPVTRLTQVFRQAAESGIIKGAHAVNAGKMPVLSSPKDPGADFVYIAAEEAEDVAEKIVAIVAKSLPKRGYDPNDVQVLTPMQRGSAGAAHLNQRLQEVLNPPGPEKAEVQRAGRLFRTGDRVMQLRNNYDKLVFNGDIGVVTDILHEDNTLIVRFADLEVAYDFSDLDELNLARAVSVHKAQGSEFAVAVIALHTQHYALLQRNLVYTALTRAKKLAVLVGNVKALAMAVRNDKQAERHTRLKERLQGLI